MTTPAIEFLGGDFVFPHVLEQLPAWLSDFPDLSIGHFETSDNVKLAYWVAGEGEPIIFVPGWSASGAHYVNVLFLLRKKYRVYVLDPRNQGLSQQVKFGTRIARFAVDLREFAHHLGVEQAHYCGWSMGASVIWSYIDLFGTKAIRKAVFVAEPISIYSHSNWTEDERRAAGGMTSSVESMIAAFVDGAPTNDLIVDTKVVKRYLEKGSKSYENSEAFANEYVSNDPDFLRLVLFDHATNDWRDVLSNKIDVPTAIFTGEETNNVPCQRWAQSVIPGSRLHIFSAAEEGDHFLMFKNPYKFTEELCSFLEHQD
ncbi:alpha/beta hydrolase [Caballeronia sp. J97]|uniref:alpha/beta fold hydrolase n=1 Tax=Caballeronia sp. J97 TaxID=2805429 RepID=UPI002AB2A12E|nr:alpha/beta hydrolase [Caballeronia sp. J97]